MPAFNSNEHASFGAVEIPDILSESYLITLSNGVKLTFGSIIALAGDYYGVPNSPISSGLTPEEMANRFRAAFNTLDTAPADDVYKLIKMISEQRAVSENAVRHDKSEFDAINNLAFKDTIESIEFTKQNYIPLAEQNLDHFNETATLAYQAGHLLAMDVASKASKVTNEVEQKKQLDRALAMEAFACHFLTDHFAAGHIRTPRKALHDRFGAQIGSLLSLFQHDEDGIQYDEKGQPIGVNVRNKRGEEWETFGDGQLFEKYSDKNRAMAQRAVRVAVGEVYQAFSEGRVLDPKEMDVMNLIPSAIERNFSPLFKLNLQNKIEFRCKLNDVRSTVYKELTDADLPEIFAYYGANYAEKSSVGKKIIDFVSTLKKDESKVVSGLANSWIFNHGHATTNTPDPVKPQRRCNCSMI